VAPNPVLTAQPRASASGRQARRNGTRSRRSGEEKERGGAVRRRRRSTGYSGHAAATKKDEKKNPKVADSNWNEF